MSPDEACAEFQRLRPRLEALAVRILRDHDEARDVASDALVAMLESPAPPRNAGWWFRTVRNASLNRLRQRARTPRRVILVPEPEDPARAIETSDAAAVVRAAMVSLRERDRAVIGMRFLEDRSVGEVARALGIPEGAARVAAHRATMRLRTAVFDLLAGRLNVSRSCADTVVAGGSHADCSGCRALSDEIAVLRTPAIMAPVTARALDWVRDGLARAEAIVMPTPTKGRVAEAALAVLLVTSSLGHAPRADGVTAPAGERARASTAVAAPGAGAPGGGQGRAVAAQTVVSDAASDQRTSVSSLPLPVLPKSVPRLLLDGIERIDPAIDIRSLEVSEARDRHGRLAGLRFRFGLSAAPDGAFIVSWRFAGTSCEGSVTLFPPSFGGRSGSASVSECEADGPARDRDEQAAVVSQVDGASIEGVVWFERTKGRMRALLGPGALLQDLRGRSTDLGFVFAAQDRVPDDGGITYRVPR